MAKTKRQLDAEIAAALLLSEPLSCSNCGGGLDGDDLAYGLVCPDCGIRVAGPFDSSDDVPSYKSIIKKWQ